MVPVTFEEISLFHFFTLRVFSLIFTGRIHQQSSSAVPLEMLYQYVPFYAKQFLMHQPWYVSRADLIDLIEFAFLSEIKTSRTSTSDTM